MIVFAVVFAICCLTAQARPGYHEQGHEKLDGVPGLDDYGKLTYPKFDVLDLGSEAKGELPPKEIVITKHVKVTETKPYPVKVPYPVHVHVPVPKPYPIVQNKVVHVPQPYPIEVVKKVAVPVEVPKPYPVPAEEYKPPHHEAPVSDYGGTFGGSLTQHDQGGLDHGGLDQGGLDQGHSFGGSDSGHSFGGSALGYEQGGLEQGHDSQQLGASYGVPGQEHGSPLGASDYSGHENGLLDSYEAFKAAQQSGSLDGHGESDQSGQYSAVAQPKLETGGWEPSEGGDNGDGHQSADSQSQHQ